MLKTGKFFKSFPSPHSILPIYHPVSCTREWMEYVSTKNRVSQDDNVLYNPENLLLMQTTRPPYLYVCEKVFSLFSRLVLTYLLANACDVCCYYFV